eukprot:11093973-Alexandrium_andersonii.AAC.1
MAGCTVAGYCICPVEVGLAHAAGDVDGAAPCSVPTQGGPPFGSCPDRPHFLGRGHGARCGGAVSACGGVGGPCWADEA